MTKSMFFTGIIFLLGVNAALSQWNTNGNHIYNNNAGFVGIGNSSPATLLHAAKNMTEPAITVQNLGGAGGATYRMWDIASGADWKFKATMVGGFKIRDNANSLDVIVIEPNSAANRFYINTDGNVGIGTDSPSTLLEVAGQTKIYSLSGPTTLRLQNRTNQDYSQVVFHDHESQYMGYLGYIGDDAPYGSRDSTVEFGTSGVDITLRPGENETMRLTGTGNVGIGTPTPNASAKLDIAATDKGLLIPRMTNEQIATFGSTLDAADKGMLVFNTDDIKIEYWDGTAWKTMVTKTTTSGGSSDGTSFCSEGVTDYDGHQYKTVKIGDQCWMAENLKSTTYADGSAITDNWPYNDDEALAHTYGRLYKWAAVMHGAASSDSNPSGVQGICPTGWHVPSDAEWKQLEMTLGLTTAETSGEGWRGSHGEGRRLKETDDAFLWTVNAGTNGTNNSEFTALPGGYRYPYGGFSDLTIGAYFWCSTESSSIYGWYRLLHYNYAGVCRGGSIFKTYGFSVRCLKD